MVVIFIESIKYLFRSCFIILFCLLIIISHLNYSYRWKNNKEARELYIYFKLCNKGKLVNKKILKNKKEPKISIITPIYNRANYILRFLRSVQNQFYDDIEIILVDDFSTDNSVNLIEKYQKEDERIILLKHKKNKGTLITRNEGVLFSKGEYIIIPDPDDILSKDILNECYKVSKVKNLEMIRFNILDKSSNNIFFDIYTNKLESRVIYQPELSFYLFYGIGYLEQNDFNLSNKFIKRMAYIRALNSMSKFFLGQYMTNFEDGIMNFILYRTVNSFYFMNKIGYYYIRNNESITLKPLVNHDNNMKHVFLHLKLVLENTKNNQYEKDMANAVFKRFQDMIKENYYLVKKDFKFYLDVINRYLNCKFINKEYKQLLNLIKHLYKFINISEINKFYFV